MADTSSDYQPRKPQASQYYHYVEDHFETLEQVYDTRFAKQYGFFRAYVKQVIYRYLDCGILHNGFARVKFGECGHKFFRALATFSGTIRICTCCVRADVSNRSSGTRSSICCFQKKISRKNWWTW